MNAATLRLFKVIEIDDLRASEEKLEYDRYFLEDSIRYGFVVDPKINMDKELFRTIKKVIGISGEEANSSFHKSWMIIKETSQEILFLHAMMHYITTYGAESLGVFDEDHVYIPAEKLEIPEITEDIKLTYIMGATAAEIKKMVIGVISSGMALQAWAIEDILTIIKTKGYKDMLLYTKNKEIKGALYDLYDQAPRSPEEYLRYVVYKLTGLTQVIKNEDTVKMLKNSDQELLDDLIKRAPSDLARIFLRYKPIFLAMKKVSNNKTYFNRLRRKANWLHQPMESDYLNDVTALAKKGQLNLRYLTNKLEKTPNIFRKVRLAEALLQRLNPAENAVAYRVRNGKVWVQEHQYSSDKTTVKEALDRVMCSIVDSISINIDGKTIYIPPYINYTVPSSQKKMVGPIPEGSYIEVPKDLILGIHWENLKSKRVDLDLSVNTNEMKIGWDSTYKGEEDELLFSGDITSPNPETGASEVFYIGKIEEGLLYTLFLNFYNKGEETRPIPTKLFIGTDEDCQKKMCKNYVVDPNKIITSVLLNGNVVQNNIGMFQRINNRIRFYFTNSAIGQGNTFYVNDKYVPLFHEYLASSVNNRLDLKAIIQKAGGRVIQKKESEEEKVIDLSPEKINVNTILNLLV